MRLLIRSLKSLKSIELYKIFKLRVDVFVVEQKCPYKECDNKDQDSYHLFYQDQDEIAAYLRIIPAGIAHPEISIGRVLVNYKYRRNGLAKKIMKKAISFIKENFDSQNIKLSAQEYILAMYQDLGFEIVSDRYLEDGIPHYEMIYKL